MKKIFTILFLACATTMLCQKKVALLEPRSAEGSESIAAMEKAMIRGEMRKALIQMDGYEAFSRTDIDQVMNEQGFQRSGIVSDKDIHRLGEMSGADYICVTTITKSSTEFYLEAYLIDVETGKISSPASQYGELVNGKFSNLLPVCQWLASELTGKQPVRNIVQENAQNQSSENRQPQNVSSSPNNGYSTYVQPKNQPAPLHWNIDSRPQGADIYWRVVSSTPEVKSQNFKYLGTAPYEATEVLNISGLTMDNAAEVQIVIKCEKDGYYSQTKRFSLSSVLDEKELSIFFKLVKDE